MAVETLYGDGLVVSTNWTDPANAQGAPDAVSATAAVVGSPLYLTLANLSGSDNIETSSVTFAIRWTALQGTTGRAQSALAELTNEAGNVVYGTFNTGARSDAALATFTGTLALTHDRATVAGYRIRVTPQEGGGMGGTMTHYVDAVWAEVTYEAVVNQPPVITPIGNQTVDEGSLLQVQVVATDPENDALTYSLDVFPVGATISASGLFQWTPADGPDVQNVTVRVTDDGAPNEFATTSFQVTVNNVAPTIEVSGAATVEQDAVFTLTLGAVTDPGTDTVTSYIVRWGDGGTDTYGTAGAKTHTYLAPGSMSVLVDLVDEDGTHLAAGSHEVLVTEPAVDLRALDYGALSTGPWTSHPYTSWTDTAIGITPNLPAGEYYWRITLREGEQLVVGPNTVTAGLAGTFLKAYIEGVFVQGELKRWVDPDWLPEKLQRWDGNAWVDA